MKKILISKYKYFIVAFLIVYFFFFIVVGILVFNKNILGYVSFNGKTYISVDSHIANSKYKYNDLIVIKKLNINRVYVDSDIFIFKEINGKKIIVIGSISGIDYEKEKVLIKNDSSYYDYDIVIGSYYDRYDGMGKFFNFISSDFLFIFLILLPLLCYLIFYLEFFKFNKLKNINNDKSINKDFYSFIFKGKNLFNKKVDNNTTKIDENFILKDNIKGKDYYEVPVIIKVINNDDLEDSLSKITVTHVDETDKLEVVDIKNEIDDLKKDTSNKNDNKTFSLEIGKNQDNLIFKILDLKSTEISSIVNILASFSNNSVDLDIFTKISLQYLFFKYLEPIEYSLEDLNNKNDILIKKITDYVHDLNDIDKDTKELYVNYIIYYNYFNDDYNNINEVVNLIFDSGFSSEDKLLITDSIKDATIKYRKLIDVFYDSINSSKLFKIQINQIKDLDIFVARLESNIKFSNIFSGYIINDSYSKDGVSINLDTILLKILCSRFIKEMLNYDYKNKYIVKLGSYFINDRKKLDLFLYNVKDLFSQSKIYFLVDFDLINNNFELLELYSTLGYKFATQLIFSDITKVDFDRKKLFICSKIFFIGEINENEKNAFFSTDLVDRIIKIDKKIDCEVIINDTN